MLILSRTLPSRGAAPISPARPSLSHSARFEQAGLRQGDPVLIEALEDGELRIPRGELDFKPEEEARRQERAEEVKKKKEEE